MAHPVTKNYWYNGQRTLVFRGVDPISVSVARERTTGGVLHSGRTTRRRFVKEEVSSMVYLAYYPVAVIAAMFALSSAAFIG